MKKSVYTLQRRKRVLENSLTVSIFEASRKPRKKKPFIYKRDDTEQLITVPVSKTPQKQQEDPNFAELDKLLSSKEHAVSSPASFSSLPQDILKGNIEKLNSETVEKKYKDRQFPLPRSKSELKKRTEKHLAVIPKILAGEEELSFYFTLAMQQRKNLANSTMTLEERWDIQWDKYVGGFYGLKRQLFVSTLIQERYNEMLSKSTNRTVKYWSEDMFATYVLANEIILRLIMEDMELSKEDAERVMKDSVDYGCKLADEQEFEDDLEFGEL